MKSVTIKDVAKAAGVSYSTVSRALSGSPEISEETRERIIRMCKEMNYMPNTVARAMVMKSTKLLGLILPSINNPFMSEMAYHIDRQVRARGYNIVLCNSSGDPEQEREQFELMIARQVDGILLLPAMADSYALLEPYLSR
ncbi:MAG: LacI family DNA-binding transcriptional regulator, partial [Firmicutes bacterium]|nr:LacI family DNA-binding transcriptional regulator [Bacillota bacterium]